jgi:hypothetical protein
MKRGVGCTVATMDLGGHAVDRSPNRDSTVCHDCAVTLGQFHHFGCDMEQCPRCEGQLLSCGCWDDDEDDESDFAWFDQTAS